MWSQIVTASNVFENKFRNKKYLPYAITEQGIAMLSGLFRNEVAIIEDKQIIEKIINF